jgi:hypothetical protein
VSPYAGQIGRSAFGGRLRTAEGPFSSRWPAGPNATCPTANDAQWAFWLKLIGFARSADVGAEIVETHRPLFSPGI